MASNPWMIVSAEINTFRSKRINFSHGRFETNRQNQTPNNRVKNNILFYFGLKSRYIISLSNVTKIEIKSKLSSLL